MGHFSEEHKCVQVKVNAFIDEGVAPLVAALNEFDGVMTMDSCEKSPIHGSPFVSFLYGDYALQPTVAFVWELKEKLDELRMCCGWELSIGLPVEDNGYPHGVLVVGPKLLRKVAEHLRKIAPEINRRRSELLHDTEDKAPRSC